MSISTSHEALPLILCTIPHAATMIGRGQTFVYGAIGDGRIEAVKSDKLHPCRREIVSQICRFSSAREDQATAAPTGGLTPWGNGVATSVAE